MEEPKAPRREHRMEKFGDVRVDPWFWLREMGDPETIPYLNAENAYTEWVMKDTLSLQQELFAELRARVKEDDSSVPEPEGDFAYFTRYRPGAEYPVFCRQGESGEEVLLDANQLAAGKKFLRMGVCRNSPDHRLLCYSTDLDGSERYEMRVRDLHTGETLLDTIEGTYHGLVWLLDSSGFFYTLLDELLRPKRVLLHHVGTDPKMDILIYREEDEKYSLHLKGSLNGRFVFISSEGNNASEWRFLETADPDHQLRLIQERRDGVEYEVEDGGDRFLILNNAEETPDFRVSEAPYDAPNAENWIDWLPQTEGRHLQSLVVYADHAVISERREGLQQLRVVRLIDREEHLVTFDEAAYTVQPRRGREWDTQVIRFDYQSMTSPPTVFEYDLVSRDRKVLKQTEVLGDYDPERLVTRRVLVTARDGTQVPLSILMDKGTPLDGSAPLVLTGYGSYGNCLEASFHANRLSLVHRGFIWVLAHVRGGREMGQQWYEEGKLLNKRNTFTDFVDCADYLVREGYTSEGEIAAMGGSAGGLLMGVVLNDRPELFRAIIAGVPWVDALSTMLDASLPLTTLEYNEWGNPNVEEFYHYIKSYSPYDHVKEQAYPHLLSTAGLHDPRVTYWEPAKWTASLRHHRTNENMLLLKTKMDSGHSGASGRFDALKDVAMEWAFVLKAFERDRD